MKYKKSPILISNEKARDEIMRAVKMIVLGMGIVAAAGITAGIIFAQKSGKERRKDMKNAENTIENIKDTAQKKAKEVTDSVADSAKKVCNTIKGVSVKTKSVKKDIEDGYHEVIKDVHETAENVSDELNRPSK